MKYLISIISLLLLVNTTNAQENVEWMSWEEAMTAAETSPKKIYIDVYTDWCGYCKKMDKTTFKDPTVVKYLNDNFYPVKFNAEQKGKINFNDTEFGYISGGGRGVHELAYALLNGRLGYPAFVILDEEFARILISPGFKGPDAVMMEMEFAKDEKYKTTAWTTYQNQYMAAKNQNSNLPATNTATKPAVKPATKPTTKASNNSNSANKTKAKPTAKNNNVNTRNASSKSDTIVPPPPPPPPSREDEIFRVVEEMPRFSGCEDQGLTKSETQKCAEEKMLQYIYKNLVYPTEAKANKTDGMVVIQFVVDKQGKITDTKIVRDIGDGCGQAAADVVNGMPNWIPGKQRGQPIKVFYTLPVRFKLDKKATPPSEVRSNNAEVMKAAKEANQPKAKTNIPPPPPPVDEIFKVVEDMPQFPGCENMEGSKSEIRDCAKDKMLEFIYNTLEYPNLAKENGVEGTVVLQFIVDKEGNLTDTKIVRDIGANCGEAALEVVKKMPKWSPGKQRGREVKVLYTLPVKFKLEKNKKKNKR